MSAEIIRVLDRVIELLTPAGSWRQGAYAGKRIGEAASSPNGKWEVIAESSIYDSAANCFCLLGAIDKICGVHNSPLGLRVREAIRKCWGIKEMLSDWNDASWRTHDDVLAAVIGTRDQLSQGAPS
jgi:hypothetical protein